MRTARSTTTSSSSRCRELQLRLAGDRVQRPLGVAAHPAARLCTAQQCGMLLAAVLAVRMPALERRPGGTVSACGVAARSPPGGTRVISTLGAAATPAASSKACFCPLLLQGRAANQPAGAPVPQAGHLFRAPRLPRDPRQLREGPALLPLHRQGQCLCRAEGRGGGWVATAGCALSERSGWGPHRGPGPVCVLWAWSR